MSKLTTQLQQSLDEIASTAPNPSPDAWNRIMSLIGDATDAPVISDRSTHPASDNVVHLETTEHFMLSPNNTPTATTTPARRWSMIGAAAAAVILVVAFFAVVTRDDDQGAPVDQPAPEATDAPVADDSAATITVAEQFLAAMTSSDAQAAAALVAEDATLNNLGQTHTRDEIAAGLAVEDAWGNRTTIESCDVPDADNPQRVECVGEYYDAMMDAVGGVQADLTVYITVEDGQISAYRFAIDPDPFRIDGGATEPIPWSDYVVFVQENHGGDVSELLARGGFNDTRYVPLLTMRSAELHQQYTEEFIAAQN